MRFFVPPFLLLLPLLLAACGGAPTETAQVATATTIPTFAYVAPTAPASVAAAAAATQTAQVASAGGIDPEAVERGRARYEALGCAECHGENGEGVNDVAPLSASTQTEDEFIAFMRSGGDIGPEHQFASNRLSASGGRNLYQYLLSLREGG